MKSSFLGYPISLFQKHRRQSDPWLEEESLRVIRYAHFSWPQQSYYSALCNSLQISGRLKKARSFLLTLLWIPVTDKIPLRSPVSKLRTWFISFVDCSINFWILSVPYDFSLVIFHAVIFSNAYRSTKCSG